MTWQDQALWNPNDPRSGRAAGDQLQQALRTPSYPTTHLSTSVGAVWVPAGVGVGHAAVAPTAGYTHFQPIFLSESWSVAELAMNVTATGGGSPSVWLGLYKADPDTWAPSGQPYAYGGATSGSTGAVSTGPLASGSVVLKPGLWWAAANAVVAPAGSSLLSWQPVNAQVANATLATVAVAGTCLQHTVVDASLPTLTAADTYTFVANMPIVYMKASAAS